MGVGGGKGAAVRIRETSAPARVGFSMSSVYLRFAPGRAHNTLSRRWMVLVTWTATVTPLCYVQERGSCNDCLSV